MFGLFKKEKPTTAPEVKGGFFSTLSDIRFDKSASDAERRALFEQMTFQRPMQDMRIVKDTGAETFAMDEAYPDLQLTKIQNSLGGFLPTTQLGWYASQGFIGYQTAAMISQQWLVNKACTMPARDAVRHWFEITVNDGSNLDPEVVEYIRLRNKQLKLKNNAIEFLRMGRIFGVRIALFEVESSDPNYYFNPFNIDGIKPGSYRGISQIDPYWITPLLDSQSAANPASKHFYEPTWWMINGKRVHRTHLVIMRNGGELPDILKPTYLYGGIPLPQMIAERIYAAERVANEAPMLAMSKRLTVLNVDISQAMANSQAFEDKMQLWTQIMNNYGVKVVGENETITQFDTALSDLDAIIMTQYQIVAAVAECPATKLLGTSPKGFGASGEYEESSYHEFLESLQENDLTPLVDRHHELLLKSEVFPKFGSRCPKRIEAAWKPTDTPTEKEQAEINLIQAQTDNQLVQAGAIDGFDSRNRIIKDPSSGYNGIEEIVPDGPGDREAQQEQEAALEAPVTSKAKVSEGGDEALSEAFKDVEAVLKDAGKSH